MTRLLSISAAVIASLATGVQAAQPPTTKPAKPIVLILPFASPSGDGATWVGRSAKDDMVVALRQKLDATVKTPSSNREVPDVASAVNLGHQYHANFVIYGYAQEADTVARVTGQVIDVETGQPIGGLKVTGPATSILDIDDALTAQALMSLPSTMVKPEALAMLQQSLQPVGPEIDEPMGDGVTMVSQSYPVGSSTFLPDMLQDAPVPYVQNVSYIYSPTIVVSAGYGYGGTYAPEYYGPQFGYPGTVFTTPHRHEHLPVIHHGPARPRGPRGGADAGIVIADRSGAGVPAAGGANFTYGQNAGPVSTPFMGGGQSFPVQNGFVSSGASSGFSVFTGPRFSNTPNLMRGNGGRGR